MIRSSQPNLINIGINRFAGLVCTPSPMEQNKKNRPVYFGSTDEFVAINLRDPKVLSHTIGELLLRANVSEETKKFICYAVNRHDLISSNAPGFNLEVQEQTKILTEVYSLLSSLPRIHEDSASVERKDLLYGQAREADATIMRMIWPGRRIAEHFKNFVNTTETAYSLDKILEKIQSI